MLVAVMSDSHDNIPALRRAVSISVDRGCGMIIHCGDFVAPFMLNELDAAGIPVHGVFGNNDGDRYLLTKNSLTVCKNITLHGWFGKVDAGGRTIAFIHDGTVADDLAAGGRYDIVCFGHFHVYSRKMVGNTLVLNPGELLGKDGPPGFCILDTESLQVERVECKGD